MRYRRIILPVSVVGGLIAGILLYSAICHMKFSPFSFSRPEAVYSARLHGGVLNCRGAIVRDKEPFTLRLFAPDALIQLDGFESEINLCIENLFPESSITFNGKPLRKISSGFRVGSGLLRITSPLEGSFSFIAFGDVECRTETDIEQLKKALTGLVRKTEADFVILLGDIVRDDKMMLEKVADVLAGLDFPVYAVVGNHDYSCSTGDAFCRQLAPFNYHFAYSGTLFLFFNNADEFPPACFPSNEMDAVCARLEGVSAKCVIFISHKPLYDPRPGHHHHMNRHSAADFLKRRIVDAGVDAVLSGHIGVWDKRKEKNTLFVIAGKGVDSESKAAFVTVSPEGKITADPVSVWSE